MGRRTAGIILEARDVSKVYGSGEKARVALRDINLEIREGELILLLGPSGCGKTTFLNIVAGFLTITDGNLECRGRPVGKPEPSRGVIFQDATLFPWMSVKDNLLFGPKVRGLLEKNGKEKYERRARELLEMANLIGFENHLPRELSGGMRSRAALIRTLINDPDILLADEPFASLDAYTKEALQDVFLDIWEKTNSTILFITHDIEEAVYLADKICVMTHAPGTIKSMVDIELNRPRDRYSEGFSEYRKRIYELVKPEL
jgi:NitT/TauT family transport system ATP-binding protein